MHARKWGGKNEKNWVKNNEIRLFTQIMLYNKVEKERAFVIRTPHPSMERWPAESVVALRSRDRHRQHHPSHLQQPLSFNRRRNNIFKRAKMKSL